ncbi:MAG: hypothetical protein Barrevirus26_2 [Barrevirus sp.]|uniref:Uncharacterized protein n=1 Tax=Barrevirus sp. TaxID=2487763 RepID=A0A3G4ZV18_9VIRU|nr:MAG: hypothetical protein Barrevirus26_2 [Barrevirus sp.]
MGKLKGEPYSAGSYSDLEDEQSDTDNIEKNDQIGISPVDPNDITVKDDIKNMIDLAFKNQCDIIEDHMFSEHDETTSAFVNRHLSRIMDNLFTGKLSFTDITIKIITDMKLEFDQDKTILLKMKHNDNIPIAKIFKDVTLENINAAIDRIPPHFPVDRDVLVDKLSVLFNINENNTPISKGLENDHTDRLHLEI